MIETLEIKVNGHKYQVSKGVTLEELASQFQKDYRYPILLAKVNNVLKELTTEITHQANIEFLDLTSREGNRTHISGLTYVLIYAIKKLYGKNADALVQHSLDKGIYIETNFKLTSSKVAAIKEEMQKIVDSDMPITKMTIDRLEAIDYFEKIGEKVKAGVMRYNTNTYITLYRLGNYYNYFYNLMPTSTGKLGAFNLTYIKENGFLLQFPTVYISEKIKPYQPHPGMFEAFQEYREWAKIMKVENSVDLNRVISTGKISDLIRIDETLQSNRLLMLSRRINENKDKIKIVLLAGPSSSGKTTTSRKLCMFLQSFGLHPKVLSMDDYFVEREENPKDENGNPDYECLEAIDLKLFDSQLSDLLKGKEVTIPTFNFALGKKEYRDKLTLQSDDIIVIEGIHALDPKILTNISRENKFKIYISPLTELNMDNQNRISTTDNRLLRRIIRDNRTRGYDVEHTLRSWASVREGEEKYIFPYQDEADYTINSALIYEIGVLKTYVEPLLYSVPNDSPYYEEAKRLINFLRLFLPIPADDIPQDSILREFIGNGCFHD
ncbi:phosphoribulokinase/uridine kinase [Mycoplasma sp. CAG:877]|nr:phosphoribulokinase/uridine kinase [Mycoplasma sp. CAG:877]